MPTLLSAQLAAQARWERRQAAARNNRLGLPNIDEPEPEPRSREPRRIHLDQGTMPPPGTLPWELRKRGSPADHPFKALAKRIRLDITAPTVWQEEEKRRKPKQLRGKDEEEESAVTVKRRKAVEMDKALEEVMCYLSSQSDGPAEKGETSKEEKEVERLPILSFSDEVLSIIFRRLTRLQRVPLSLTCQRFHTVNLDLGSNRFVSMNVDWTNLVQSVSGVIGGSEYSFTTDPSSQQVTTTGARVFRNAVVEALTVKFAQSEGDDPEHPFSHIVDNLLRTVAYDKVQVQFDCDRDYIVKFDSLIRNRRDLKNVQVGLSWSRLCSHNVSRAQQILSLVTKVDKLKVEWQLTDGRMGSYASITPDQCLLNDDLLARLTIRATEMDLIAFGDYTAAGVLEAFDMVCRSKIKRKSVAIYVKKAVIDEIFSKEYDNYQANIKQGVVKYLYCAERQAVLTASFSKIWMQKRWTS